MKRLTTNQQQYLKQVRRIRSSLSTLRKQGYDVSDLATKYTTDLPNRVTAKTLRDLSDINIRKLRKELQDKFIGVAPSFKTTEGKRLFIPLTTPPTAYKEVKEPKTKKPIIRKEPLPEQTMTGNMMETYMEIPSEEPKKKSSFVEQALKKAVTEFNKQTTTITNDDGTITKIDKTTGEIIYQQIIQGNKILTIDSNGEIIDEQPYNSPVSTPETPIDTIPITPEEFDISIPPIEPETYTEPYEEIPYDYDYPEPDYEQTPFTPIDNGETERIDASEMALEYLRDIINSYKPSFAQLLTKALNQMLEQTGTIATADAFTKVVQDNPNLLEKMGSGSDRYEAALDMMGEIAEELDISLNLREGLRTEITNESMADIEKYMG